VCRPEVIVAANSIGADPNLRSLLNSERPPLGNTGGTRDVVCKVEALTAYRDQLRHELAGVEAELKHLAHALAP
jgi:hypothetical protein